MKGAGLVWNIPPTYSSPGSLAASTNVAYDKISETVYLVGGLTTL